ncbi:unnamed protein product [Rotaria sp. Silwood2]|nr:unnamed protein product [Rotaria sp. Silwood2]CAF3136631.1 unnamed protein product [Rotaria sp. Silwood2]CAF3434198.1 unnamed protein product [Rotaria sp. Silwood2]CAF4182979.1 unnamed protein product [Rotaria sp. Silwood2]CAF4303465.1 unnamed protein product [Rotaria sp. Silwood2]
MALDTLFKNNEKDEDLLIKIYNNMARIYKQKFNYQAAINYCDKVLQLELNSDIIMKNHEAIATTYSNRGTIYFLMRDYQSVLQNYEKALEIASKSLRSDHSYVVEYRNDIAVTKIHIQYQKNKKFLNNK